MLNLKQFTICYLHYDRENFIRLYASACSYDVSEAEQRNAQLLIWRSTNKISTKIWAIMGVVLALAILGLIFIKNYSTVFAGLLLLL